MTQNGVEQRERERRERRERERDTERKEREQCKRKKSKGCLVDEKAKAKKRLSHLLNANDIMEHATNKEYPCWRHYKRV